MALSCLIETFPASLLLLIILQQRCHLVAPLHGKSPHIVHTQEHNSTIVYPRHLQEDAYSFCPVRRRKRPKRRMIKPSGDRFNEVSYLECSRQKYKGHEVIWIGSDGSWKELSAVDLETGEIIRTYRLGIREKGDLEAISLGPCTSDGEEICIYIGNVGNNRSQWCEEKNCDYGKSKVELYKFPEPDIRARVVETITVSTLVIDYDHDEMPTDRADCETLFVDYTGDDVGGMRGDIYLVTKFPGLEQQQVVAKLPVTEHENLEIGDSMSFSLIPVGYPSLKGYQNAWTGGDMTTDGTLIALRDYWRVHFFPRPRTMTVGEALEMEPCDFTSDTDYEIRDEERYFETVSMDGNGFMLEAHECTRPKRGCTVAVSIYRLRYNNEARARSASLFPTVHT